MKQAKLYFEAYKPGHKETEKQEVAFYVLKGWENVARYRDLPTIYTSSIPCFWQTNKGDLLVKKDKLPRIYKRGDVLTKSEVEELIETCKEAGNFLSRVLKGYEIEEVKI